MADKFAAEREELGGYLSDGEFDSRFLDEAFEKDMGNVIVVDNLPEGVPEAKYSKLFDFVKKIYSAYGTILTLHMPQHAESKNTEGFAFIEYSSPAEAELAQKSTMGYAFDKQHTLHVLRYADYAAYVSEPDRFVPPALPEFKEPASLHEWLRDSAGREQFLLRANMVQEEAGSAAGGGAAARAEETQIWWAKKSTEPQPAYLGEHQKNSGRYWTEREARWSPRGTYLATFHPQGLALWGGAAFGSIGRFGHSDARDALFSPDERWLLTWNGHADNKEPARSLIIWDVRTQTEVRAMKQLRQADSRHECSWSADSKYLARLGVDPSTSKELVQVYEAPAFGLLDSRSHQAPGARDLSWCPASGQNLLAWWTPETDNKPATVSLMRLPGRAIKSVQVFSVESIELFWHPGGDYLAIVAPRRKRKGVGAAAGGGSAANAAALRHPGYTLQILRLKGSKAGEISAESMDLDVRVQHFAWEPRGSRFSVVSGEGAGSKYTVTFYAVGEKSISQVLELPDKAANQVHWNPRGDLCVLAGLGALSGSLEWYDVAAKKSLADGAGMQEHQYATGLAWDPSGRLLATWKNQAMPAAGGRALVAKEASQNGYMLWNAHGTRMHSLIKDNMRLYAFSWRPRPESSLSEAEAAAVVRDLRSFSKKYADLDKFEENEKETKGLLEMHEKRAAYKKLQAELARQWLEDRPRRAALGAREPDEELATDTLVEQIFEKVLEEKVEAL